MHVAVLRHEHERVLRRDHKGRRLGLRGCGRGVHLDDGVGAVAGAADLEVLLSACLLDHAVERLEELAYADLALEGLVVDVRGSGHELVNQPNGDATHAVAAHQPLADAGDERSQAAALCHAGEDASEGNGESEPTRVHAGESSLRRGIDA
ncbi:PP17 [Orf virus]|uniref:PP17 n=1 Tax=Orf virus TaxID=10258 RepID=F1AXG3_ORFV|nr:PP17 [Orf virus]